MSTSYLHEGEESTGLKVEYGNTLCIDGGLAVDAQLFGTILVYNGGEARDVTIDGYYDSKLVKCVGGAMEVQEGGTARGITVLGKVSNDSLSLSQKIFTGTLSVLGGAAYDVSVATYGKLVVSSGTVDGLTLAPVAICTVEAGGVIGGRITLKMSCRLTMEEGSVLDFTVANCACEESALLNDISMVPETASLTITVLENQSFGRYCLAENATKFDRSIAVKADGEILADASLAQAGNSDATQRTYSLTLEDSALWLEITPTNGEFSCVANADGVSYTISIAADAPQSLLLQQNGSEAQVDVLKSATLWNLSGGQLALSLKGGSAAEAIENAASANIVVRASGETQADVFLANVSGKWKDGYYANHMGTLDGWKGTDEKISLKGKNVIGSIFDGGADTQTILCLTDDANGDALFVDDIYTALPNGVAEAQARIAQIDEIRAGAGDDVVDMTSQLFEYVGKGVTVRGGQGDDVIWANTGDNMLFGDEGNDCLVGAGGNDVLVGGIGDDYMHGGGGRDIFSFCENWGNDVVEQLAGGKVVLWFTSESDGKWDEETLTYTDGENSVRVMGVEAREVELKFGGESEQYDQLLAAGAFDAFSSQRIFENKGMLA